MNLFRSEEHAKNWSQYDPAAAEGTMPLADYATLFGIRLFQSRLDPDYTERVMELAVDWITTLMSLGRTGTFWQLGST
jgi:hypothetical protein